MTVYKAGDEITLKLSDLSARQLNRIEAIDWNKKEIISHKPAPEPIVGWVNVYPEYGWRCHMRKDLATNSDCPDRLATIKLTYSPSTRSATAEVVS